MKTDTSTSVVDRSTSIIEITVEEGNIDVVLRTTLWGDSLQDDGYDYGRVGRKQLPELVETILDDLQNAGWDRPLKKEGE